MMDDFSDILLPAAVAAGLPVRGKKQLFDRLGTVAATLVDVTPKLIAERLSEREKLGSTGFGGGVAIPHGKIEGLERVTGMFAQLSTPIDFAAVDAMPVDLVFALLSPPDAGVEHLKALARVSRKMRDRGFVAKLRGAGSTDAIYALLVSGETRDAA